MANTYTQLYIHLVFATKQRADIHDKNFKESIQKYITGIFKNKNQYLITINFHINHIHILFSYNPSILLSELVRDVKISSTNYVNENEFLKGKFYWQEGYSAFSCSKSQLGKIINYIENQERHHKRKTFKEEYLEFLKAYDIPYDERYVLKDV
jgi:REP element-mobilizing transposase RayT